MVAPASASGEAKIQQLCSLQNLNIEVPPNTFKEAIIFHSNTDKERFRFLKNSLYDTSKNTIVWTYRGGEGSARLIPFLKNLPKPNQEKIFIGYSDITALHLFLSQNWHWKTLHGAFLCELLNPKKDPKNFQKIADFITKKTPVLNIKNLHPLNSHAKNTKKISGLLTGGNLTMVETSIGTDWQMQAKNKIVFLEDVEEKGYQVDRALAHLKQAGLLKEVKAIVFGDFVEGDEFVSLALERFGAETNIPVFKTNQFGHGKTNYPLLYNAHATLFLEKDQCDFALEMR